MKSTNNLMINRADFEKLSSLVKNINSNTAELLEDELNRASLVDSENLPKDVVAMQSTVTFQDIETGKESEITLVYPHEARAEEGKISILTPVGAALIGLKVGQTIQWPFPGGKKKELKVISVVS